MKQILVCCDLCKRAYRHDPPDEHGPGEGDWEGLTNPQGKYYDVCSGCQNVITRAYHYGILDQVVEIIKSELKNNDDPSSTRGI